MAWRKADGLVVRIYEATQSFPSEERFGVTSQIRRAGVSVAANIAEGCGRETVADFRHFLHLARGSLYEVEYYIHLSGRLGYLQPPAQSELAALSSETAKILQGLINSLDRQITQGRRTN